ncbi:DUF3718 domain-containing protein [Shewanella sp. AS16]|uniref:DUF3718 domain-containing protein n=1 Tax=Shewanella sp. AS16 TaxID=2907625 RepID=UPI001F2B54FB|nr:DUF3718 domain-containing protein [Shewanella sp. AS16]MCE9686475.1 DUF3718 domain-containing protein [Shewanella sp. AS16]
MKSYLVISTLLLSGWAIDTQAENYVFVAANHKPETKICVSAGSNQQPKLRLQMNAYSPLLRFTTNNIICNDMSLTQFAYRYGAMDSYAYLNRYTRSYNKVKERVTIHDIAAVPGHKADDNETVFVYVSAR